MALNKLNHKYTEPLQVSSLSVDGNLNAGGTINASNFTINGNSLIPNLSGYLTISSASTTYLTISTAASTYGSLIASNTFTAANTFSPTSTTSIPVTINTPNASISNALVLNQNGSTKAIITAAGQTLINSSSPILGAVNQSTGFLTASTASSTTVATYTSSSLTNPFVTGIYTNFYNITPSYFNGTFLVTATGGSTNAWTATVYNPAATFTASGTGTAFGAFRGTATFSITSHNTYSPTLIVKPASNGTANLTEWQSSASATVRYIDSNGASISTLSDTAASFIPTSSTVPVNGMFLPAANTVAISTNTAEAMRIDSSGNVGIGGTPGQPLDIINSGANNVNVRVRNSAGITDLYTLAAGDTFLVNQTTGKSLILATQATERMRITSAGLVGIGTNSPNAPLEIYNSTTGITPLSLFVRGGSGGTANDGGSIAFSTASGSTSTTFNTSSAGIRSLNVYAGESNGEAGSLAFYTNNRTGSNTYTGNTERMRIDSSGNVMVNTTTPTNASGYGSLTINGTNGVLWSSLVNGTETFRIQPTSTYTVINQIANLPLLFNTNNTERMRIDSSGNVAIATTSSNIRGSSGGQFLTLAGGSLPGAVLELYNINTDGTGNYGTIVFGANSAGLAGNKSIAQVEAYTSGTTANNRGGNLIFSTKADGGSSAIRLTIDSTGNVGIGTSPVGKLHTILGTSYSPGANWSSNTALFATGGTATSGAFGIAYDDTLGTSLSSIVPGTAWKPLSIYAISTSLYYSGTLTGLVLNSSGNVSVNNNISVGTGFSTNGTSPGLTVSGGSGYINFLNSASAGAYNPATNAGDKLIYFSNGTSGTGSLLIAPWSGTSSGVRIDSGGTTTIYQGSTGSSALALTSSNNYGGTGYAGLITLTNTTSGATNPNKYLRLNNVGGFEIVNNAYNAVIFGISDTGVVTSAGGFNGNATTATNATQSTYAIQNNLWDGTSLFQGSNAISTSGGRNVNLAPNTYVRSGGLFEFKNATFFAGPGNYRGLITYAPWDSTSASTGDPAYQIMYSPSTANSTASPHMFIRAGIDTTWGGWAKVPTISSNTTAKSAGYTLTYTDAETIMQLSTTSAVITVPLNSSVPYPIGTQMHFLSVSGQPSFSFTSGITAYYTPGLKLRTTGSMCTLIKLNTDTWVLTGDLSA